jgi:hypothetical protein
MIFGLRRRNSGSQNYESTAILHTRFQRNILPKRICSAWAKAILLLLPGDPTFWHRLMKLSNTRSSYKLNSPLNSPSDRSRNPLRPRRLLKSELPIPLLTKNHDHLGVGDVSSKCSLNLTSLIEFDSFDCHNLINSIFIDAFRT